MNKTATTGFRFSYGFPGGKTFRDFISINYKQLSYTFQAEQFYSYYREEYFFLSLITPGQYASYKNECHDPN